MSWSEKTLCRRVSATAEAARLTCSEISSRVWSVMASVRISRTRETLARSVTRRMYRGSSAVEGTRSMHWSRYSWYPEPVSSATCTGSGALPSENSREMASQATRPGPSKSASPVALSSSPASSGFWSTAPMHPAWAPSQSERRLSV